MIEDYDHPDIESALRTGYPTFGQERDSALECEVCGVTISVDVNNLFHFACEDGVNRLLCLRCAKEEAFTIINGMDGEEFASAFDCEVEFSEY